MTKQEGLLKKDYANETKKIERWQELLSKSIVNEEQLDQICKTDVDKQRLKEVIKKFPMRVNPYYLSLIKKAGDGIWKQAIPDTEELDDDEGFDDPLCEDRDMPVEGLTHRYPDRILLLITNNCPMICRFCTRKRKIGDPKYAVTKDQLRKGFDYIRAHPEIRDVLLSGGDPLMVNDKFLEWVLSELKQIPHIEFIRIGTRMPCSMPQRVTPELCEMLKKYHPLFININFTHPDEITPESKKACEMLADAGIPLSSQTVLLKGVNDDPKVMKDLMQKLLTIRVRPYYIYQADMTRGVNHFRTMVDKGMEIMEHLRGWTTGLAVPYFVVDAPGGGGKIPVLPNYVVAKTDKKLVLRNYEGKTFTYEEP